MIEKKFFLHISFGLGVYIADAKNGIFAIFSGLAISKKVIISDISGRTLVFPRVISNFHSSDFQLFFLASFESRIGHETTEGELVTPATKGTVP